MVLNNKFLKRSNFRESNKKKEALNSLINDQLI